MDSIPFKSAVTSFEFISIPTLLASAILFFLQNFVLLGNFAQERKEWELRHVLKIQQGHPLSQKCRRKPCKASTQLNNWLAWKKKKNPTLIKFSTGKGTRGSGGEAEQKETEAAEEWLRVLDRFWQSDVTSWSILWKIQLPLLVNKTPIEDWMVLAVQLSRTCPIVHATSLGDDAWGIPGHAKNGEHGVLSKLLENGTQTSAEGLGLRVGSPIKWREFTQALGKKGGSVCSCKY